MSSGFATGIGVITGAEVEYGEFSLSQNLRIDRENGQILGNAQGSLSGKGFLRAQIIHSGYRLIGNAPREN